MKPYMLLFMLFGACWSVPGQNEANWWFFGSFAGMDFNNGAPVATTVGSLDTIEGCASIADACGGLLFYTDGITVWDRTHQVMSNGDGLLGDPSSTQSAIIIPIPLQAARYYVVTVGDMMPVTGLNYSVVDMTLNGGLGAVVPGQKNINLLPDATEKVTAAATATGDAAWIISFAEQVPGSGSFNSFYAFKLTANGIDRAATVRSTFNNVQTTDRRGYLSVAPDGNAIAMMTQQFVDPTNVRETGRGAWFFNFNNATGVVSNALRLPFPSNLHAYGTVFSPDSSKIYVDLNTQPSGIRGERTLYQYDRSLPNFQNVPFTVYQTSPNDPADDVARGGMQLGPDGVIYYTRHNTEWLATISNPNGAGAAANFLLDGFRVATGTTVQQGLPPFYNAFFNPSFGVAAGCVGARSLFQAAAIASCPGSSVLWDFGDPASGTANTATMANPTHVYNTTGTYTVTLTITTRHGVYRSTKIINIENSPVANAIAPIVVCGNAASPSTSVINAAPLIAEALGSQNPATMRITVHATLADATADFNELPDPFNASSGTYYVRVANRAANSCFITVPVTITVFASPQAYPVSDLITCDDSSNDGIAMVHLASAGAQALGNQATQAFQTSYHSTQQDATQGTNPLPEWYTTTARNETLFIRIQNRQNPDCYSLMPVQLILSYLPVIPVLDDVTTCDDPTQDGVELFDLAALQPLLTSGQPASLLVSYHASQQDALSNQAALPSSYRNTTRSQTIWVRLENQASPSCIDVQPLELVVYPKPVVTLPADFTKCIDDQVVLQATPGFESYRWNTGDTTSSIAVTDPGTYTVTITAATGCTDTAWVTISAYEPTRIVGVAVDQFTIRNNRIAITATGSGRLTYSLDAVFYQESPVFERLIPGYYTVYVRDDNGCDLVSQPVNIIAAPNFFTPNGDGFHDTWQVIAIETEPDAQIYIFDRFGKLLKQLDPLSVGWDGTYLNNPMPSTDYWYLVQLGDGQSFKGHFTLKR